MPELQFDGDVDAALEASSKGGVDQQLQTMCTFIICIGDEGFGIKQPKAKTIARPNRRENKITALRKDLKTLKQCFKKASEEERPWLCSETSSGRCSSPYVVLSGTGGRVERGPASALPL